MAAAELGRVSGSAAARSLGTQVLTSRWFMFFASLLIMSMSGGTYIFGIYSGDIKAVLGYDQTTLNLIGFFKEIGSNIGIVSGVVNEATPPWVTLAVGAAMNFSGYFMVWLAVTGRTSRPRVWQMCVYFFLGSNSQTFSNTAALVTCVKNFPESRGIVIGLLKGFTGLSGAVLTQLFRAFYGRDSKGLILLIAWLPAAVSCFFLSTVRLIKSGRQENELKIFYHLLYVSLGLAGFIMVMILLQNGLAFSRAAYAGAASVVLVLLFAPLGIVVREEFKNWKTKKNYPSLVAVEDKDPPPPLPAEMVAPPPRDQKKLVPWWRDVFKPPERGEDYSILQALFSLDMIILFTIITFGVSGTLTAMDNLGQIGKSLGYPAQSITTSVSLVSIWNYLGKVASGFTSEIFLAKYKFPRPLMLTLVLLLSCIGHLLIAFGVPYSLYISSVIMGFSFGAEWPLIFTIISELFGLKYYSTLYAFGGATSPLGTYILNVRIAGRLYDKEATKQMAAKGLIRKPGEDLSCTGVECYKVAFLIITASTMVGCIVSFVLVIRTWKFYKGDIYKKFREQEVSERRD